MATVSDGSSSFKKVPRVALMMPAPIRTTSGSLMNVLGMEALLALWIGNARFFHRAPHLASGALVLARPKRHRGPRLKDDIRASPRLIVSQPPAMSAADRVLGEQDVARTDEEVLTLARLEVERPTERYDQLPDGRIMPGEGAARGRLLKRDGRRRHFAAQHVAPGAGFKVNDALLEIRVFVVSRPYPYAPDHGAAPVFASAFVLRDSGPAAAKRGSAGRNG